MSREKLFVFDKYGLVQMGLSSRAFLGTCGNFDRDASPIFLGLKFGQILFFWISKFFSYFSRFRKISTTFLGLPIFVSHT